MIEYRLNIGDVIASSRNVSYTCFGLGSCIGLFLHDRTTSFSGAAHIFLPERVTVESQWNKFYDVTSALDALLGQFAAMGSDLQAVRAKVTGGASITGRGMDTGLQNGKAVLSELINRRIYIAAADIGGTSARTARFNSTTAELHVHFPERRESKIY